MRKGKTTIRRGAAVVAMALGTLAIAGSGAGAAGANLPDILNGQSDAQALRLKVTVPGTAEIQAVLKEAGLDTSAVDLSGLGLDGLTIDQKISLTHGEVLRSLEDGATDVASGWASVLQGLLGGDMPTAQTRCTGADCSDAIATDATRIDLPLGLGHVILNGASSKTASLVDTRNDTALAQVLVDPEELLATLGVDTQLRELTNTFNTTVIPVVNDVIETADETIHSLPLDNTEKDIIDRIVTLDPVDPLPDLTKVDLVSLDVLGSTSNIFPETRTGVEGLLAEASSKIANVALLGDWATIGSIDLKTEAYANGVKGGAKAVATSNVVDANIGDGIGVHVSGADLQFLTNPVKVYETIRKDAQLLPELEGPLTQVANASKLLLQIAGIKVELFGTEENAAKNGLWATSRAGSLKVTIEPQLINQAGLAAITSAPVGTVPLLDNDKHFTSTGLRVELTAPEAYSAVSVGNVLDEFNPPPTTGVATPLLASLMLLGGAITIRRFALAR